jgi:hypothetical protein
MAVKSLIETVTVGAGGAASIEFTDIPQDGVDLQVLVSARAQNTSYTSVMFMELNGITSGYNIIRITGTGSAANTSASTLAIIGIAAGGTSTANTFGSTGITIPNYAVNAVKVASAEGMGENNSTASIIQPLAYKTNITNAVTSLKLLLSGTTLAEYSTASLYKIKYD